jgi:UDPglucose 6-dehydrogenase
MKIGIIGNGFVGKATNILQCNDIDIYCYDIVPEACVPLGTTLLDLVEQCAIIFISVPTPMDENGKCYLKILESVVNQIENLNYQGFLCIRSTVPVGTSKRLQCYFMPEFLTEANYKNDFITNKCWIFGLLETDTKERQNKFIHDIKQLFHYAHQEKKIEHDDIQFVSSEEAEMIKLFRNCFLATKVAFCNEMYQFCSLKNVNYENVRKLATMDERITESHSNVPGKDGHFGFGGTCFPKDMSNLCHTMKEIGMKSFIVQAAIDRNEEVDRKEKDWLQNKGRASI